MTLRPCKHLMVVDNTQITRFTSLLVALLCSCSLALAEAQPDATPKKDAPPCAPSPEAMKSAQEAMASAGKFMSEGKPAAAIPELEKALKAIGADDPIGFSIYSVRGLAYLMTQQYAPAEKDFSKCLALLGPDAVPRTPEEVAMLDKAMPNVAGVVKICFNGQFICHEVLGQFDDAVNDLTRDLTLHPEEAFISYTCRGNHYLIMGQNDKAIEDLEKALKLKQSEELKKTLETVKGFGKLPDKERESIKVALKKQFKVEALKLAKDLEKHMIGPAPKLKESANKPCSTESENTKPAPTK